MSFHPGNRKAQGQLHHHVPEPKEQLERGQELTLHRESQGEDKQQWEQVLVVLLHFHISFYSKSSNS